MINVEIINKLASRGLRIKKTYFSQIIANPFYAGFVMGNVVGWELIKGHHPPPVDEETFINTNELLAQAVNIGIRKVACTEELPLKLFVKEETSGSPFTGIRRKVIGITKSEQLE